MVEPNFVGTLEVLTKHGVNFIVVGGVGAVLQGAPMNTFDVDVVHSRTPENVSRLLGAIRELEGYYRNHPQKPVPAESHLRSSGHQLLRTRFGDVDFLGTAGDKQTYEDLASFTSMVEISDGVSVRVLNLDKIIELKEFANRDKDRAELPTLRAALEERSRQGL